MTKKIFFLIALILYSCSSLESDLTEYSPKVLASTTFLADIAQNVAGDGLQVASLLPYGVDPHSYQPTPQDVVRIANCELLIVNGANYEHFIEQVISNAEGQRILIEASAGIQAVTEVHGENFELDPHFWLDPNLVKRYVENIRDGLMEYDPEGADVYQANAKRYIAQLEDLDSWINKQVMSIPADRRLLVTNHDSLGYFAKRYGFTVVGTVVEGTSSNAAPSAQQMAELIDQIKATGAPAVFLDAAEASTLANQIAADTNVMVVTDLHLGSLTAGNPAPSYISMIKHNVTMIVESLK